MEETFVEKSESEFRTYASGLVRNTTNAASRKQALTYLQMVLSQDRVAQTAELKAIRLKQAEQTKKQNAMDDLLGTHKFDYSKQSALFSSDVLTAEEFTAALSVQNSELYISGRQVTGDVTIAANGILIDGEGTGLSARTQSLVNTAKITGALIVNASDFVCRNVDFVSTGGKAIVFGAGVRNVTFENCTFTAPANNADSKWFYGANLGGAITITNCLVKNFTSWLLADFSSASGEPQQDTTKVRIKRCLFLNNHGSMASRGKTGARTKLVQFKNNKLETDTLHSLFWDFFEANGSKKVEIIDNEFIAPAGTEQQVGKKGCCQVWAKTTQSNRPWTITYSGNKVSNLKVGLKIAHNTGFRAPDSDSDDFLIDITAAQTNVTYPVSFLYKNNDGSTASADKWLPAGNGSYTPDNISEYSAVPSVVNPSSYTIVQ